VREQPQAVLCRFYRFLRDFSTEIEAFYVVAGLLQVVGFRSNSS